MLEIDNLSAAYGSFQALFGVDLRVDAGEAVGVIGPNGAGKTTLMRVISGLLPGRAHKLAFEGRPLDRVPARSEEHTSELQSRFDLVCRLLLEKKTCRGQALKGEARLRRASAGDGRLASAAVRDCDCRATAGR